MPAKFHEIPSMGQDVKEKKWTDGQGENSIPPLKLCFGRGIKNSVPHLKHCLGRGYNNTEKVKIKCLNNTV